jgi:hypothetical protein
LARRVSIHGSLERVVALWHHARDPCQRPEEDDQQNEGDETLLGQAVALAATALGTEDLVTNKYLAGQGVHLQGRQRGRCEIGGAGQGEGSAIVVFG